MCASWVPVYLRLFAFCDKDRSGTLDWKEFKHLVRDTLAVPQEAVAKLEAVSAGGDWLLLAVALTE